MTRLLHGRRLHGRRSNSRRSNSRRSNSMWPSGRRRGIRAWLRGSGRAVLRWSPAYASVTLLAGTETGLRFLLGTYLHGPRHQPSVLVGALVAVVPAAALAARLPAGALYRPNRASRLLAVSGAVSAACFAFVGLPTSSPAIAGLLVVGGLGWSVATTVQLAVLTLGSSGSGTTIAVMSWYAVMTSVGAGAGSAVFGALVRPLGYGACFVIAGAAVAAGAVLTMVDVRWRAGIRSGPDAQPRARTAAVREEVAARAWGVYRRMPGLVWAGVALMCYINALNGVVVTFFPVLAQDHGITLGSAGLLVTALSGASMTVRFGSGIALTGATARRLTLPLVLVSATAMGVTPLALGSAALELPMFLAMGASRGLLRVTGSAAAFDAVADEHLAGPTSALLSAGLDGGKIVGPFFGGVIGATVGLPAIFVLIPAGFCILYLVPVIAGAWRRLRSTGPHT